MFTATLEQPVKASMSPRAIEHRTHGQTHGPITRLMSPGDFGQVLKPFIFLDLVNFDEALGDGRFGLHPHSGIATLTHMLQGDVKYEDSTGQAGVLKAGGVEWMQAGGGVWHAGEALGPTPGKGFQLWVALPAATENAPAYSQYLAPAQVPQVGHARVLLGQYGGTQSLVTAPSDMTYLSVHLQVGERWCYSPPAGHTVAWLAVAQGRLNAGATVGTGELVTFAASESDINILAETETRFVLGSAVPHPHPLVMGRYSVHTSRAALIQGEAGIDRVRLQMRQAGALR